MKVPAALFIASVAPQLSTAIDNGACCRAVTTPARGPPRCLQRRRPMLPPHRCMGGRHCSRQRSHAIAHRQPCHLRLRARYLCCVCRTTPQDWVAHHRA